MKMFLVMLLTSALSLNIAMADTKKSITPSEQIKRSENYSKILKTSAKDYRAIAADLTTASIFPTVATAGLKTIVTVETMYLTWTLGARLLVCKSCDIGWDLVEIVGSIARVGITGGTGYFSMFKYPNINTRNNPALKNVDSAKVEYIQNKIQEVTFVDLNLRSNKPEAVQLFKNMSSYDRQEYLSRISDMLKQMPNTFQVVQTNLGKTISNMLSENDPSNKSYLARIFTLGEDQLLFGQIAINGAIAREEVALEFIKINDSLIAEYKKALSLNNQN